MKYTKDTAPETIEFNGTTYKRMGGKRRYYLSQSTRNAERKRAKGLHVAIWEFHSGTAVPEGHEVHHKDGNSFNFTPENLECLPMREHRHQPKINKWHGTEAHLDRVRPLATNWHKSETGREWHRKHAYESIAKPGFKQPKRSIKGTINCSWCGEETTFMDERKRYCSNKCQVQLSAWKRGIRKRPHPYYARTQTG